MDKTLTETQIRNAARSHGLPYAVVRAIIEIESGGKGFDANTGKILIQFEPHVFKKKAPYTPSGLWSLNKVERQTAEWMAFDDAAAKGSLNDAMYSTSWGMMQVMGFNHTIVGFKTPLEMVEFAEVSEANQLELGLRFIKANPTLYKAAVNKDWATFARIYNGPAYAVNAYDTKLAAAYKKWAPPVLKKGSTGKAVLELSALLAAYNVDIPPKITAPADLFDDKIAEAVKDFQRKNGLVADGIVGEKTWTELWK